MAQWLRLTSPVKFHLGPAVATGDRKSTRLNSSHSQISYAVFCLKKKKKSMSFRSGLNSNSAVARRTYVAVRAGSGAAVAVVFGTTPNGAHVGQAAPVRARRCGA